MLTAESITLEEFKRVLEAYPAVVEKLSKPAKNPTETLKELDEFRYGEAIRRYEKGEFEHDIRPMRKQDLNKLVTWKLKHGTWRPKLAQLVDSNSDLDIANATKIAARGLMIGSEISLTLDAAIKVISSLKGVGPATASLILSVYFPNIVVFFADEVYYWLVKDGKKTKMNYTVKEYKDLTLKLTDFRKRLDVSAMDVERVAFVLINDPHGHSLDMGDGVDEKDVKAAQRESRKAKKQVEEAKKEVENAEEYAEKTQEYVDELKNKAKITKKVNANHTTAGQIRDEFKERDRLGMAENTGKGVKAKDERHSALPEKARNKENEAKVQAEGGNATPEKENIKKRKSATAGNEATQPLRRSGRGKA